MLVINIKDKDITRDEPIGMMKLAPGDISETYVTKGQDVGEFEYHVDYKTTKYPAPHTGNKLPAKKAKRR